MSDFDGKKYLKTMSKELHKPVVRRFKRAQVITKGIDDVWACDLADMGEFRKENENYRYILTVIDCFSRFAWAKAVKDKTGDTVLNAFKEIVSESKRKPSRIWSDQGKEFLNKKMKKWLDDNDITLYHTYGEHKASIVERFNRTLKSIMWKRLTAEQTEKWIDWIPEILEIYNTTKHSSIKMTPEKASLKKHESKLWKYQYGDAQVDAAEEKPEEKQKFKLGDWVRISKVKRTFEKGYTHNWSQEIFKIFEMAMTSPPTYKLKDTNGEVIKGSFYGQELQKTALGDVFLVEKVIKSRTVNGKKQDFIKWIGYPDSFNQWVDHTDVMDLKK